MAGRDRGPEVGGIPVPNGTVLDFELIVADVHGDLAYTVGYERSSVSVAGGPVQAAFLRATQTYRRENGDWKLVHRHADPADIPATEALKSAHSAPGRRIPPLGVTRS
jgi:hypothetical protein